MTLCTKRMSRLSAFGATATSFAVMLLASNSALAADASTMETVTVTGIRASLQNTITLKKESSQIVEAVSMEDIGKLPDQSIAEAISRLPGLAAQRLNGRAQNISIRGLAPDFSTTLLNGREQVSTGDNRSVQYDQYPSELMSGVVVFKTPSADLVGQGLSGTVDMRTIRPLDYDHRVMTFGLRGEAGTQGKFFSNMPMYGYRANGTYVDQYYGGKLGVTFGVSEIVSPQQFMQFGSWGYPTVGSTTDLTSGGDKFQANADLLKRSSAMLTVQYRPNENFESTIDGFYTHYSDDLRYFRVEMPLYSYGGDSYGNSIGLAPGYTISDNGMVTAGTYTGGVKAVVREQHNTAKDDLYAVGWKNQYTSGNWTTALDLGWSSVQRHNRFLETYAGTGRSSSDGGTAAIGPTDTVSFKTNAQNLPVITHTLDYGSYDTIVLTAPQHWGPVPGGQDGYLNNQYVHDNLATARLSSEVKLNDSVFNKLTFGVYYSNRHKSYTPDEYYLDLTANVNSYTKNGTYSNQVIPEKYRQGTSRALSLFGIDKAVTWDQDALLVDGYYTGYNRKDAQFNNYADVVSQMFRVDEMTYTGYVKGSFAFHVGGIPVSGDTGVQFVETHQSSVGYASASTSSLWNVVLPVRGATNYADFLPSLNLSANVTDNSVLRIGSARELVRARMNQMSASNSYSYNASAATSTDVTTSPWSGSVGNPKLKPWLADAVDVSYEYYFGNGGYVAAAGFYKYLENYIYQKSMLFNFAGYSYYGPAPAQMQGFVTQYVNGNGGNLEGAEFSMALPADLLWDCLSGFGLTLNTSYTDSSITQNGTQTSVPGLSKLVTNATIYYEQDGFSVRLNESYRSKFLGEVNGDKGNNQQFKNIGDQGFMDAQIGYTFQSGTLEGLSVLLQVENITNQTQVQYQVNPKSHDDVTQLLDWERYGTTYLFGVSYRM